MNKAFDNLMIFDEYILLCNNILLRYIQYVYYMYNMNVHNSFILNTKKLKTIQMFLGM